MVAIRTQLFDDATRLQESLAPELAAGCDVVVLLSLGLEAGSLASFASATPPNVPVLLADCYGILGFSATEGRNLELMEAGRGQEYGGPGGDGGSGVTALIMSGGGVTATIDRLPEQSTAHMVVAAQGSNVRAVLSKRASRAVYYGGIAKATYSYNRAAGRFEPVPHFLLSTISDPVGTTSFSSDPKGSVQQLLDALPGGRNVQAVGLFPCFMRGKNTYGENNVEPNVVSELVPGVPIYGMFAHGELGPTECMGFDPRQESGECCRQHSMTTIVAMHTAHPQ
jgi:hypothetical protein